MKENLRKSEDTSRKNENDQQEARNGLSLLAKQIMALINKDPCSYIAQGQGLEPKTNKENILADYYLILLSPPLKKE